MRLGEGLETSSHKTLQASKPEEQWVKVRYCAVALQKKEKTKTKPKKEKEGRKNVVCKQDCRLRNEESPELLTERRLLQCYS